MSVCHPDVFGCRLFAGGVVMRGGEGYGWGCVGSPGVKFRPLSWGFMLRIGCVAGVPLFVLVVFLSSACCRRFVRRPWDQCK